MKTQISYLRKRKPRPLLLKIAVIIVPILVIGFIFTSDLVKTFAVGDTVTTNWDLSTPGEYATSDDSLVEITGGVAQHKVQNYADDENTELLLHLDEANGAVASDSSSNSTDGAVTNGTFGAGILNNGLALGGANSRIEVDDSAGVSLGQSHTIELWSKLSESFSASNNEARQGLIDKGDYSLYYDDETGKITYELANSAATEWSQEAGNDINNSWDLNGKLAVHDTVAVGSDIYTALGNAVGDAEVWKYSAGVWQQVGGDGRNSGWDAATYESAFSLATSGTILYVGLGTTAGDGEVWSCVIASGCDDWTKIGGDGINSSWAVSTFEGVYSLSYFGGNLYAGLGNGANDAEVWRWNGTSWTKIGGDSLNSGWTTNFDLVYSMTNDGTNLYVGLGLTATEAEVWRWNGTVWSKLGGDGVNSSWNTVYEYVLSLDYYGTSLYAGLGTTAGEAEVWEYAGGTWSQIGGDSIASSWTAAGNYEGVYSLTNDGTNLYAGLGVTAGDNEVWMWDTSTWTKIGGDGLNSSFTNTHTFVSDLYYANNVLYTGLTTTNNSGAMWTYTEGVWALIGGNYVRKSWGYYNLQSVETMQIYGDHLYAGTGYTVAGNALVWKFDGTTWELVGGQGLNSSWNIGTYEIVYSMKTFGNELYVGLGSTAGDAEVWKWNGSTWVQVGGDSFNSGWTTGYEQVTSLATDEDYLYAGLGISGNDAEVWRWNGTTWGKIGGDSSNSGWTTNYELVQSMVSFNGYLYVGLGATGGDSEVWRWNGTLWEKVGGDTLGSSWDATIEYVDFLTVYNGELIASLGTSTGDAQVWKYDGSTWSQIGGDDLNSSWTGGTFERVRTMVTYNGKLYAGLGTTAGEGEVWRYDGTNWEKIGGDTVNSSWANGVVESVHSLSVYNGKLYAGLGESANVDPAIWSYGGNGVLRSTASSFNTDWRHIAATYNGSSMKLYINGVLDAQTSASVSVPDSANDLIIGSPYGSRAQGVRAGYFTGSIDEVRLSSTPRTSFNTTAYSTASQTVTPLTAVYTEDIANYSAFSATENLNGGAITYRLSNDGGSTWKYWNGSSWVTSSSVANANSYADINSNIASFPVTTGGFKWQAILTGDGTEQVQLDLVSLSAIEDIENPNPPSSIAALNQAGGGTSLTSTEWYAYTAPSFTWSGASDVGDAGLAGYYVYFGVDNSAVPSTAGSFQAGTTYNASGLVNGTTYYLRIQSKDNAQNVSTTYSAFTYKFDNSVPTNPSTITVTPTGYAATNSFTFEWPSSGDGIATDSGSGIAGYQYKTGAPSGPLSDWSSVITETSVSIDSAAYSSDVNTFYLRVVDEAGNTAATPLSVNYYYAGDGPSVPRFITATPSSNTTNSFAFSWEEPENFSGNASDLTYCYSINSLPSESTCTYTSAGATSLSASSFATQVGLNTFYVVAKNSDDVGGSINYGAYGSVTFTANTAAPGIPVGLEISDVSIKAQEAWRLALSWAVPEDIGSGVSSYKVYRADEDTDDEYAYLASVNSNNSSSGAAYIDTDLLQQNYYYKIKACDSVSNCGAFTSSVFLLPTGKFTEAAAIEDDPEVTSITTKQATVSWSTNRTSDSKVQYGKSSDDYFDAEPSNSSQVTAHEIVLTNLSPGTKYYAVAKWTDEDGNTGISDEFTFSTQPAPTVTDPTVKLAGITSITLQYTVKDASKVKIYYGKTAAFGGSLELSTSTNSTTYATTLDALEDGTKYYYKINTFDSEGEEYEGNILSFETLPRPKIADVKIQQIKNSAQPSVLVSWTTNTEVSSIVTYAPASNPADTKDEVNVALIKGVHRVLIKSLLPETPYTIVVKGRDKAGNEAQSDPQKITTATDTRPAELTDLNVEPSIALSQNKEATAQLVVSWNTDEPTTSQVEFGEGTGSTYSQKSQEDKNLTFNHVVVISNLNTSKVYHLRAISRDKAGNIANSVDTVTITPKASDNALNLVITNLGEVFGFLKGVEY